jgi:hypothetical protein
MRTPLASLALTFALAAPCFAQGDPAPPATSPSQSNAQSEAGEPRAMTSEPDPTPAPEPAQASPKAPAAKAASTRPAGNSAPAARAPASGAKSTAADRLELGTATVTGDREQPKVMYIVPWKKSDIGDLSGKPMNSLLDEALAPVDRDEFKRQVMYYQVVKADASQNGAAKPPAAQGEK